MEKLLNKKMMKRVYNINGYNVMVDEDLSELFRTDVNKLVEENSNEFVIGYYWTITDEEFYMLRNFEKTIELNQIKSDKTHKVYTELGIVKICYLIGDEESNETCIKILNSMVNINEDKYSYKIQVNNIIKELDERLLEQENRLKLLLNDDIKIEDIN